MMTYPNSNIDKKLLLSGVEVNLKDLFYFARGKVRFVLICFLVTEMLMVGLTSLVSEQYQAHALVRLGQARNTENQGIQGMVVKRVSAELGDDASLVPRSYGVVMVSAIGESPEHAIAKAQKACNLLITYSKEAMDSAPPYNKALIESTKEEIQKIDKNISQLVKSEEKSTSKMVSGDIFTIMTHADLLRYRSDLNYKLLEAEIERSSGFVIPQVLAWPLADAKPFRPNWARNLLAGGFFGILFGLFIVLLSGMANQVGKNYLEQNSREAET